jgi:GTP-binding protein
MKKLLILGRPNVGKSTLFNRLVGRKASIVDDQPGVTRDWQCHRGTLGDLVFDVIDTAGLDGFESLEMKEKIWQQAESVLSQADVVLFMTDATQGLMSGDKALGKFLRKHNIPVVMVANKCDGRVGQDNLHEFHRLGFDVPIPISASHGDGWVDLYEALQPYLDNHVIPERAEERPLHLAIVGRPNAGKSTLVNQLLGEERLLTGDQPGVTRDAISLDWAYGGQQIRLVDTAGLRRKSRIDDPLEKMAAQDTLEAIRYADVVVLVLDGRAPLEKQDLNIASQVIDEGRALVLAVNKMDLVPHGFMKEVHYILERLLPQVKGIPCLPVSALFDKNLDSLMTEVLKIYETWNKRIGTGPLNRWLEEATNRHPLPLVGGGRLRIKYMTQMKTRPPTFALFVSKADELPDSYLRYLMTSMRKAFDLPGVPIRLYTRKGKNPYDHKDGKDSS